MEKVVHDMLDRTIKNLISDLVFALFEKLAHWLEARIPSRAARVVIGVLLALTAIASVVTVTALAGF
jgi:hypothetical protein